MAQLCQRQDELKKLNTRVLIISFGGLLAAQKWVEETCVTYDLLLDPERKIYDSFGLERSLLRSWDLKTIWTYIKLLASGKKWRGIQGDSSQLGGDFIIDPHGIIRLAYRSYDPTDRPSIDLLLDELRRS